MKKLFRGVKPNKMSKKSILICVMCFSFFIPSISIPSEKKVPGHPSISFKSWVASLKQEAIREGIPVKIFDMAFAEITPSARVVRLDRKQPESVLSLDQYMKNMVSNRRILAGVLLYKRYRDLFTGISNRYGVSPQYLLALWGVETNYGHSMGNFSVIQSLATLAYEGRRGAFFRRELICALKILSAGHVSLQKMKGSWAGAMGQFQFMPSTFLKYAVDHDGDGKIDIWDDPADAIASAANYLASSGWKDNVPWGVEVRLPENFPSGLLGLGKKKKAGEWFKLGLETTDKNYSIKRPDLLASIITVEGPVRHSFMVYKNYAVILKWNRSHMFAISVCTLADRIADLITLRATNIPFEEKMS